MMSIILGLLTPFKKPNCPSRTSRSIIQTLRGAWVKPLLYPSKLDWAIYEPIETLTVDLPEPPLEDVTAITLPLALGAASS